MSNVTHSVFSRPEWMSDAACRGLDTDLFFPPCGAPTKDARAVCARCPVKEPCGEYGMEDKYGIFGGLTGASRRVILHDRRSA